MPLEDYGALFKSAEDSGFDYARQEAQRQQQMLQNQQIQAQTQLTQQKLKNDQLYQTDMTGVMMDPNPRSISGLILKHPEKASEIKSAYDVMDKGRQTADLQHMGEIWSAVSNKKFDLAASLVQRRIDADKVAGEDTEHDQAVLDALQSGDPVQQKAAAAMIGTTLASITGPDKFEQTYGALTKGAEGYTLTPGAKRFDSDNNQVASAPAAQQYREIKRTDADGTEHTEIVAIGGDTGGGGQSSSPGGVNPGASGLTKVSPKMASVASTLSSAGLPAPVVAGFMGNFHIEGGYDGAQGDGGSASGIAQWHNDRAAQFQKVIGKSVTNATPAEQAKFVAWEMQNPEAAGMTVAQRDQILAAKTPSQAAALIDKFYERSSGDARQGRMTAANAYAGIVNGGQAPQGGAPAAPGPNGNVVYSTVSKPAAAAGEDGLDEPTINLYAQQIMAGGQMPALGMGKVAAQARMQIMKRVASISASMGANGGDLAMAQARFKAKSANVANLEKQFGTVQAAEQTALANGQQFIDRSRELRHQNSYPIWNSAAQSYLRNTSDPTMAAMDAAWTTFSSEYAKVISGSPSGAGTLSDSARHEAQDTMKGDAGYEAKLSAFQQMQTDMANRTHALQSQINQGYSELAGHVRQVANPPAQVRTIQDYNKLPKGASYLDPQGNHRTKQ